MIFVLTGKTIDITYFYVCDKNRCCLASIKFNYDYSLLRNSGNNKHKLNTIQYDS